MPRPLKRKAMRRVLCGNPDASTSAITTTATMPFDFGKTPHEAGANLAALISMCELVTAAQPAADNTAPYTIYVTITHDSARAAFKDVELILSAHPDTKTTLFLDGLGTGHYGYQHCQAPTCKHHHRNPRLHPSKGREDRLQQSHAGDH